MKTIRYSVFQAVFVAGAIGFAGCDPALDTQNPGAPLDTPDTKADDDACVPPGCTDAAAPAQNDAGAPTQNDGGPTAPAVSQLPDTGDEATVNAWIAKGDYKQWKCEAAPHAARPPGAHGRNRICSNKLLSEHGAGEYPVGAAGVKEIYDNASSNIVGYAMYRKMAAGAGEAWYWFETLDDGGLVANGLGNAGVARTVCVKCHRDAGLMGNLGHDLVFTQVK